MHRHCNKKYKSENCSFIQGSTWSKTNVNTQSNSNKHAKVSENNNKKEKEKVFIEKESGKKAKGK